jgi:hypothetical protein
MTGKPRPLKRSRSQGGTASLFTRCLLEWMAKSRNTTRVPNVAVGKATTDSRLTVSAVFQKTGLSPKTSRSRSSRAGLWGLATLIP